MPSVLPFIFVKQLFFQMKQDLQGKVIYFPRSADIIGEKKKKTFWATISSVSLILVMLSFRYLAAAHQLRYEC